MEWKMTNNGFSSHKSKISLVTLACFSLLITIACKNSSSIQEFSNDRQNLQSVEIQKSSKPESAETDETIEKDFVMLFTRKQSPVKIVDVVSVNEKSDFKRGAKIEIQNISDKAISSISLGFAPPVFCNEYMMVGDLIIDDDEITKTNKIQIGEKHFVNVTANFAANHLSPQSFKTCPRKYRKPMVYIWEVQFEDGESWNNDDLKQNSN